MVSSITSNSIKLSSRPYFKRSGLIPFVIISGIAWIMITGWLIIGIWSLRHNFIWSIGIIATSVTFSLYLGFMTFKLIQDSFCNYVLELNDSEIYLKAIDKCHHKQSTQMALLKDIKFVEYYPYRDSASIILHTNYTDMQIPLWPFVVSGQDVVDFLEGKGVHVINIHSDEDFPD